MGTTTRGLCPTTDPTTTTDRRTSQLVMPYGRVDDFKAGQRFSLENKHNVGPATMWDVAGSSDMHFTVAFRRYR